MTHCPTCGGELETILGGIISEVFIPTYHVPGRDLPRRERLTTFYACTGCEWCAEVHVIRRAAEESARASTARA
jgi:hypothetical protein